MRRKPDFPLHLSIQTTSLCNASCIFCPYPETKDLFPPMVMDRNLFEKIIHECRKYKKIININLFMNNEPLTDPFLIERIDYVNKKVPWAFVNIFTNGLLLTDGMGDKLISSNLYWISISFHGIRKTTIKNVMGIPYDTALNRILKFIEKAKKKKDIKDFIGINFLKHEHLSDEEKEETISYWKNKGIEQISFFQGPISRAGNVKSLPKIYNRGKILGCSSVVEEDMIHINEDGKVTLCCADWRREVVLGDLNSQSILEIWNGKRKEVWEMIHGRVEMPDDFICRRCEEAVVNREYRDISDNLAVLLVTIPPWDLKTASAGVTSLASILSSHNIKAEILDLNLIVWNRVPEAHKILWEPENLNNWRDGEGFKGLVHRKGMREYINYCTEYLLSVSTQIMYFSVNSFNLRFAIEVVKKLKKYNPSLTIVFGGHDCSVDTGSKTALKDLAILFISGEDAESLRKILESKNARNE